MTKDLIEVPDFNPDSLYYLTEVVEHIKYEYVPRTYQTSYEPIISVYASHKEQVRYWTKFIFKSYAREYSEHVKKSRRLVRDDPLEPLWKIQSKYSKLLYKKFIFERQERFTPKLSNYYNVESLYYEVKFLEIKESLITYLRNKVETEDVELVNKLQELFIGKSTHLDFYEFIERKVKFLLELDLSNYIEELNKQTNKKIKINR